MEYREIKIKIEELITKGYYSQSIDLLESLIEKNIYDIELYSMYSVALSMIKDYEEAINICLKGLDIEPYNFDLNYNLGCLYENIEDYSKAKTYFYLSLNECNNEELKENINIILNNDIYKDYNIQNKIVFFVKRGLDSFLLDIINELSKEYVVKKVIVENFQQIDKWMEWSDICWFEWCDELVEYGSNKELAISKKIICRLHSYEAFDLSLDNIMWSNIDKIIFISEKIKDIITSKYNLDSNKTIVIANGINIEKYKYMDRKNGFNIAYVGYINYKKGPMLLLHTFKAIYDMDKRYKLYISGIFQDTRDYLYFNQMIEEFGVKDNVIFDGWQDDLNNWLEDKNYILCTSLLESQNISVMQAMAKGIKPIIHNFVGAREIYKDKFIWNTIDKTIEMIEDKEYNSIEYREFIEKNYSLEIQMKEINKVIRYVFELESKKNEEYKSFYYDNKKITFYLPYLNDWVQRVIYQTNNFYEKEMLMDIKDRIKKDSIIIDVGANIGNHTIFFSKICNAQRVYSFEPQKNIFKILSTNIKLNNVENIVKLYNIGLGSEYKFANVKVIDRNNYGSSKLEVSEDGSVEVNKLDNIISVDNIKKVDIIKIDVEGMELEVLEGAKEILNKFKPILYIEAAIESELYELMEFLKEFNYELVQRFNATPTYLFINKNI